MHIRLIISLCKQALIYSVNSIHLTGTILSPLKVKAVIPNGLSFAKLNVTASIRQHQRPCLHSGPTIVWLNRNHFFQNYKHFPRFRQNIVRSRDLVHCL